MNRQAYMEVRGHQDAVALMSTDAEAVRSAVAALNITDLVDDLTEMRVHSESRRSICSEFWIEAYQGNGMSIWLWIVKQLCLHGWEPFQVDVVEAQAGHKTRTIHLRLAS